jgi:hypothetical protein
MKAHRRNGIPTLMLQDGGGSLISRFFNANPAQRKAREQQRMGLRSILLAKPTPLTNIDQQSYDIITEAIRPLQSFYQQSESGSASRGMSPTDYAKSLADSYVKLGEYISGSQVGTGLRRSNADPNPVLQVGSQFAANLQERIGAEINRVNPVEPVSDSMYEFSVQDALLGSAQDSAARAEADALRQATGAPTRAEEAAATATTPAATATLLELPRLLLELPRLLLKLRRLLLKLRRLLLKLRRLLLKLRRLLLRLLPLKAQKKRPFVRRRVRRPKPKKLLRLPRLPLELPLSSPSLSNQMIVLRVH